MSRALNLKRLANEEYSDVEVRDIILDLINTNFSKDNDSQGRAVSLLKGLAFSDSDIANDFMKDLDLLTNTLKDKYQK